jgi:hypothetical protein
MSGLLSRGQYNKLINDTIDAWEQVVHARQMASERLGPTTMTTIDDLVAAAYTRTKTVSDLATAALCGPAEAGTAERISALTHEIEVCLKTIEAM